MAVSIAELANVVDEPFRAAYGWGEIVPRFYPDSDSTHWEQQGDDLFYILQEEVGIEPEPAEALVHALIELDPADPRDGDEPFYDDLQQYERLRLYGWEYAETWNEFAERIKYRRRFFDSEATERLGQILGTPGSPEAAELPTTTIGPEAELGRLHRARRADSVEHAARIRSNARVELSPPPRHRVSAGRMNPIGIPVFYGSLSEAVAVAEVRPALAGVVVVGSFDITRERRLLDLTKLGTSGAGSIFAPSYAERTARLGFLQSFHYLITRPVQAAEEALEYLPTQAVAEYVGRVLGYDGILYASAQSGALDEIFHPDDMTLALEPNECNVVLFGMPSSESTKEEREATYYTKYAANTARCVRVTNIEYRYSQVHFRGE